MSQRTDLFYTFGNHHHWVDMEWLWGYDVMSGSALDMLAFCEGTGAKGNANWEAGGFEKVAAEQPEAFAKFKEAVQNGTIEIVGGSYGQPYGLFQGDESNIRQMVYGVRTVMRLFGVRPRSFWEEEFYFFPQLPQVLSGVGYKNASLFFQWTWHTPEVPYEESPAIWWEGQDGSRLKTVSRNRMNVHQWPEDIQTVFSEIEHLKPDPHRPKPILLQWLELMPTKDWMCRSEVLLPKTKELLSDPRFRFEFGTLSEYLQSLPDEDLPVRRYTMDQVWHGMSLGKNGDEFRRLSRLAEQSVLSAESLASVLGLFGRPYGQWDVYPTWELEEAWRELLMAQHHDNDECEGLCGHVGKFSYERSLSLSKHVLDSSLSLLSKRATGPEGSLVVYNPLPWNRDALIEHPDTQELITVKDAPAMGYRVYEPAEAQAQPSYWTIGPDGAVGRCHDVQVQVTPDGKISQIRNRHWPEGVLREDLPLLGIEVVENKQKVQFECESMEIEENTRDLVIRMRHPVQGGMRADLRLWEGSEGVDITLTAASVPRPDPGMHKGMVMSLGTSGQGLRIVADQPLGMEEVRAENSYRKKYPTGDWMTSPQWFEDIHHPFTGNSFVDLLNEDGSKGLLVSFGRTRQWFRNGDTVQCLLTMYDPWDEDYFTNRFVAHFQLIPHREITNADRYRLAREFNRNCLVRACTGEGDMPASYAGPSTDVPNVVVTAFYREMESAGRDLDCYAGEGMAYPYVLRLLELDGRPTTVTVQVPGTVATARRSNLLGEPEGEVTVSDGKLVLDLHAHGIATVYLDIEEGRKQVRDLDAHREIWAQVHRVGEDA